MRDFPDGILAADLAIEVPTADGEHIFHHLIQGRGETPRGESSHDHGGSDQCPADEDHQGEHPHRGITAEIGRSIHGDRLRRHVRARRTIGEEHLGLELAAEGVDRTDADLHRDLHTGRIGLHLHGPAPGFLGLHLHRLSDHLTLRFIHQVGAHLLDPLKQHEGGDRSEDAREQSQAKGEPGSDAHAGGTTFLVLRFVQLPNNCGKRERMPTRIPNA